jgi:hypothetical protein
VCGAHSRELSLVQLLRELAQAEVEWEVSTEPCQGCPESEPRVAGLHPTSSLATLDVCTGISLKVSME